MASKMTNSLEQPTPKTTELIFLGKIAGTVLDDEGNVLSWIRNGPRGIGNSSVTQPMANAP